MWLYTTGKRADAGSPVGVVQSGWCQCCIFCVHTYAYHNNTQHRPCCLSSVISESQCCQIVSCQCQNLERAHSTQQKQKVQKVKVQIKLMYIVEACRSLGSSILLCPFTSYFIKTLAITLKLFGNFRNERIIRIRVSEKGTNGE